jgi:hypothetical protein
MSAADKLWLDDKLDENDLDLMMIAMQEERRKGVEETFAYEDSLPPLNAMCEERRKGVEEDSLPLPPLPLLLHAPAVPLQVPVPFATVLSVPVQTPKACPNAWTQDQDDWLAEKYSEKPTNKNWTDTLSYWAECATQFEDKFEQKRTVKALLKRISLTKLCNSRKHQLQWPLEVEKWIERNVRKNAYLSNSYLQTVFAAIQDDCQHTPRSIEALRSKIKALRPKKPHWPLEVEKWIERNVRKNAYLRNSYLQTVFAAIEDDCQYTPHSIEALRSKIKRMELHLLN